MGTGWRRALCTSVRRDDHDAATKRRPHDAPSPRTPGKLGGFFSGFGGGGSNPSTPALRCRTKPPPQPQVGPEAAASVTPPSAPAKKRMPLLQALSAPSSPRSPSRFALFKASILPTKARCGVCSHGVKNGGSSAVFTAECSHSFHFPCIAAHARSTFSGALTCPVCSAPWRQAPFLASLRLHCSSVPAVAIDDNAENRSPHHKRRISDDSGRKTPPSSGVPKVYDDDEPLLAPKAVAANGGFNPIPEADEDDEVDSGREGEFRGFFPHPPRPRSGLGEMYAEEEWDLRAPLGAPRSTSTTCLWPLSEGEIPQVGRSSTRALPPSTTTRGSVAFRSMSSVPEKAKSQESRRQILVLTQDQSNSRKVAL